MRPRSPAWWLAFCLVVGLGSACGSAETTTSDPPAPTCTKLVTDSSLALEDPPDGATACGSGDCNYQTQAGCPESQACRPQFNATDPEVHPGCEAVGAAKAGDACDAPSDCARGLYCALGTCHKMCCGADWSACDAGESCIRSVEVRAGGQVIPAGLDLCFPVGTCDPLDADSCSSEDGRECKIVDPTGAVACAPRSDADLGDACAPPTVCKQGLSCVGGYCTRLCRFEECAEPGCSADEGSCVHFLRDPEGVGECTLGR
ncbi:MAG: hypothetical protein ABUL60_35595 [Myxococcales bacterium]